MMKKNTSLLIITAVVIFLTACGTSRKVIQPGPFVVPLSDTVGITSGTIIYGLPRTVFTIKFEMERTLEIPGPYSRYAPDFLGINDAINAENEYWTITGVTVNSHEELDPSEYYVIKSTTFLQSNAISLRKEGLILDINPQQFLTSEKQSTSDGDETDQLRFSDLASDEYYKLQSDTAYKRVSIDSTFIRIPYIVEKKRRISTEQMAENAAKRIMELRDGKHLILTGEANVFPQNEAAINELNRIEKEYTELFTGKTIKEKRSYTVNVIPETGMEKKPLNLFHFSELTGPVTGARNTGVAVTAELIPEQKTKALTILEKNQMISTVSDFDRLYYRVPDIVNLKVSVGNELLFTSRKMVYQFGEIIQLPANFIISK